MNENKLVSVIVPVYNVERYIKECIDSILQQTYKSIEVLIIDDGSPDNSAYIVNEIIKNDSRIRLITKENGGVSSARNVGLDNANGEYVIFVDADDFLAKDAIKYLMWLVSKTEADFCFSKNCFTRRNEPQIEKDKIQKMSPEEAVALLLSPRIIVGCWNKIYSLDFLKRNNIRFSNTLFYGEGLNFITVCAIKSASIGVGERKTYYYRRSNETSATTKFDIQKMYNGEKALQKIKKEITIKSSLIDNMFDLHMALFCLGAVTKLINAGQKNRYINDYKRWNVILKRNTYRLMLTKDISLYRKMMLFGGVISPQFLAFLDKKRRKKISQGSF